MGERASDCYIEVWRDVNFEGEMIRIYGPAEYPDLRFVQGNWGDDIGSLRVGPKAFVLAYRDQNFKDQPVTFGPNDEVADLRELKFNDEIDSLKVIDSLKIFDRLIYHSSDEPDAAGANSAGGSKDSKLNRPGKKGRKGKRP